MTDDPEPTTDAALCQLYPVDLMHSATMYGARVAHDDLLTALASLGVTRKLYLVMDSGNADGFTSLPYVVERRIGELRSNGLDVIIRNLHSMRELFSSADTVILASGQEVTRVSSARQLVSTARSPLCTFCHSLIWSEFVASYLVTALFTNDADCIVVPSRSGCEALSICFELVRDAARMPSLSSPRVVHIPYGVFYDRFMLVDRIQSRRLLNVPLEPVIVAYVGRLSDTHKADLDVLLVAVQRVRLRGVPLFLVIAGSETRAGYKSRLEATILSMGLGECVLCYGQFDESLKPLFYAAADICVFPVDNVQETYGLAVLEAMAASRPVIASRWSGYTELVQDGTTGFLVDMHFNTERAADLEFVLTIGRSGTAEAYGARNTVMDVDALENYLFILASDGELRRRFGAEGLRRVREWYSWDMVFRRLEDLWAEQRRSARSLKRADRPRQSGSAAANLLRVYGRVAGCTPTSAIFNGRLRSAEGIAAALNCLPPSLRQKGREFLIRLYGDEGAEALAMTAYEEDIAWRLAKKGHVSLRRCPAPNCASAKPGPEKGDSCE
jgi:glycosyltransferase involved in cell wall biosynthesis